MEISNDLKSALQNVDFEGELRVKTPLRMTYDAQVRVIQQQIGHLEEIRFKLGLSQRKIAQLLLVDPSAWTRWTKKGESAPPHIWRALQWYMALQEQLPGLTPQYFLGSSLKDVESKMEQNLQFERSLRERQFSDVQASVQLMSSEKAQLEKEIIALKKGLNFHRKLSILVLSLIPVLGILFMFGFSL